MSITEFLLARIAEDEAVARVVLDSNGRPDGKGLWSVQIGVNGGDVQFAHVGVDPARVLAECAAKRAIVAEWREVTYEESWELDRIEAGYLGGIDHAVRTLAAVYAEHPQFRAEWRVGA